MLQGDQHGVAEPDVGQQLQAHQPVAGGAVVSVQHLTWVKELAHTAHGRLSRSVNAETAQSEKKKCDTPCGLITYLLITDCLLVVQPSQSPVWQVFDIEALLHN